MHDKPLLPALAFALGTAALNVTSTAMAADDTHCFNGYGYTLDSNEYRYTEHHEQHFAGDTLRSWDVTYVGRTGDTIATKHLAFKASDTVPTYRLEIPADGYVEGIRHSGDRWTMFRRESADAKEQTEDFTIEPPMAADSGFDRLVRQQFDELTAGETVPFKFAAAGRQAVIDLRARQTGTTTFEGKPAVVFTAELDMFLVNFFVDSLKLTYDADSKRLLEYRGIGNMHDENGKVYPVRVSYTRDMPAEARQAGAPAATCGAAS